ncbi:S8 family serine peptidase [Bifidobacterium aerophilum]|uniref:S8 family serine peptidase n=1 Tax=Bifidobacterium aerophilum TaxID=1798155 RepID=A0A6N9Z3P9_9BIFI|nr:S8 family serine peptidase [Bifidobacterium aerophilum]NEG89106.1 S8 family serine peptidase [Bifidobacterium aerophilum]
MAYKQWPRWIAIAASVAMLGAVPAVANADQTVDPDNIDQAVSTLRGQLSAKVLGAKGNITAFIQTTGESGVEAKTNALDSLNRQRSAMSQEAKEDKAAAVGEQSAAKAETTADKVFEQLKTIDANAQKLYTTSYAISGVAVKADAAALRTLAEQSGKVISVSAITPKTATTVSTGDTTSSENAKAQQADAAAQKAAGNEKPANKNSDPLVNAVKAWTQTGNTGKGVNVAVVDTGLDYTHADFGGAGTTAAYETALASKADPLTDPTLSKLLDKTKFKGGYDFAGPTYGSKDANGKTIDTAEPDANPIDGKGGHHGTHVSGSVAGYGVTADGKQYKGDYTKLTDGDVAGMEVGPGSAPQAGLYALKVFGDNGGTTGLVLDALDWVAEHNLKASADDKIEIVSMSLGGSFGASDDPENQAVDNLTKDGVLSVIAAGNDGDVTDITGAPGTAVSALTVAASQTGKTLQDAIEVTDGPASLKGKKLAGQYSQNYANLSNFDVEGKVVRVKAADNLEGCAAYSAEDAAAVKGNIAYVEWNDAAVNCGSGMRFNNAENAGAIGILFGSQSNIPEAGIAGNAGIPGLQLVKDAAENKDLQAAIDAGTLKVKLASSLRLSENADYSAESADTIGSFTSRGIHGSYDGTVKPDVAAPGVGIISASAGSGVGSEVMSGTSMATPLTSGVAALVRSAHKDWDAYTVKAQMINTADHDVLTADRSVAYGPLRVGAGRIDAYAAVNNGVQVSSDNTAAVTGQFGIVQVKKDGYTAKKTFTVTNRTGEDRTYKVSYDPRVAAEGVEYQLSADTVTVPANGTATFDVTLSIPDQSKLTHSADPTKALEVAGLPASYVTDASGIVKLTPANADQKDAFGLRVVVSAAPKPVSETAATYEKSEDGNTKLVISGHGIKQGEGDAAYESKATPLVYAISDPVDGYYGDKDSDPIVAQRSLAAADIRAIGYSSTAPQLADKSQGVLNFGVVTDKTWNHLGNVFMPDIVFATPYGQFLLSVVNTVGNTQADTAYAVTYQVDPKTGRLLSVVDQEAIDDAYINDSNQVVLSVKLSAIGFTAKDTSATVQFYGQTESLYAAGNAKNQYIADTTDIAELDAYDPDLWFGDAGAKDAGVSTFDDQDGTTVAVHQAAEPLLQDLKTLTLHTLGKAPDAADATATFDVDSLTAVSKDQLKALIDKANALDQKAYTDASWQALQAALEEANKVYADKSATQEQVNAAAQKLQEALDGLVKVTPEVNKDKLKAALDAAKQPKESDYTAESWKVFADARDKAQKVYDDPNATQEQVNAAEKALTAAQGALVAKPAPNKPKPEEPGTNPTNPGSDKKPGVQTGTGNGDKKADLSNTGASVAPFAAGVALAVAAAGALLEVRRRTAASTRRH